MFDERQALKLRLEQMDESESNLIMQIQKERAYIYSRLRELDHEQQPSNYQNEMKFLEATQLLEGPPHQQQDQQVKGRKSRPSRRSKTTKMRDTAIQLLREQHAPIRGADLQKMIEEQTGYRIANMTTFMKTIEKTDENIQKVSRGMYTYEENGNEEPSLSESEHT